LARKSLIWRWIWKIYPGTLGFIPWDLFLVSYLTHPEDFLCLEGTPINLVNLKNDTDYTRGGINTTEKEFLVASSQINSTSQGAYCYRIKDDHLGKIVGQW